MRTLLILAIAAVAWPARADTELAFRHADATVLEPRQLSFLAGGATYTYDPGLQVPLEIRAGVIRGLELQVGADVAGESWPATRPSPYVLGYFNAGVFTVLQGTIWKPASTWLTRLRAGAQVALVRSDHTSISGTARIEVAREPDAFPTAFGAGLVMAISSGPWLFETQVVGAYHRIFNTDAVLAEGWIRTSFTAGAIVPSFALEVDSIPATATGPYPSGGIYGAGLTTQLLGVPSIAAYLGDAFRLEFAVPGNVFGNKPWGLRLGLRVDADLGR